MDNKTARQDLETVIRVEDLALGSMRKLRAIQDWLRAEAAPAQECADAVGVASHAQHELLTEAFFRADQVPVGTKLYTRPQLKQNEYAFLKAVRNLLDNLPCTGNPLDGIAGEVEELYEKITDPVIAEPESWVSDMDRRVFEELDAEFADDPENGITVQTGDWRAAVNHLRSANPTS